MSTNVSTNASSIASGRDVLLIVPRLAQRVGSLALHHVPEALGSISSKIFPGGSVIAEATGARAANATGAALRTVIAQSTPAVEDIVQPWAQGAANVNAMTPSVMNTVNEGLTRLKSFGGIFSYLTSKWALTTFAAAFILNRTQFYASSRRHLRLGWHMRLALYLVPITTFSFQMLHVLQSMRCQTSPRFAELRYGDPKKRLTIDFGGDGGFLYWLSSTILFWQDDETCCAARHMSYNSLGDNPVQLRGSMSLLFWFFVALCTSQLFETLASSLQGRQPLPETGMTIFEHSLAFAECEAMVSSAISLGLPGLPRLDATPPPTGQAWLRITRGELMQRLNVPPEVLLICLISCFSHLSSAILAIVGKRHAVRLINTAVWSCSYMAAFLWSFARLALETDSDATNLTALRFPTVCIVGFIPHLLVIAGILMCGLVYGIAFLVTAFSVPPEMARGFTLRQRFAWAFQNLQANVQFSSASSIRIKMSEDFYTTLLKIGFNILTAASEAVYLNEGSHIYVANMTWLEQKRIDQRASEIDARRALKVPSELLDDSIARGLDYTDHQSGAVGVSPYARERRSKSSLGAMDKTAGGDLDSGLGMTQRRSRMHLTFEFLAGIFWLLLRIQARVMLGLVSKLGMSNRPAWLVKLARDRIISNRSGSQQFAARGSLEPNFGFLGLDGKVTSLQNEHVDIEEETRRRLQLHGEVNEESLSATLYAWWRSGGWFGTLDTSGDYEESKRGDAVDDDEDNTSVVSSSVGGSELDAWSDVSDEGQLTPTPRNPLGKDSRESTPVPDDTRIDISVLSRLLDPRTPEDREEARLLSRSLQYSRPLTRSQYRLDRERSRFQLLKGLRGSSADMLTEEEEERDLELFILAQRSKPRAQSVNQGTWETGAEGMGTTGPQCVVCQSSPRSILVWPCGCLSMCDDCRIGLAARNYTKCICCRTDLAAYSRLYVP